MYYHRILAVLFVATLVWHVVDVGGFIAHNAIPAEIRNITAKRIEISDDNRYNDGVYQAETYGFGPSLVVEVTIKKDMIKEVEIISHRERGSVFYQPAFDNVPKWIIEEQTYDVDSVAGSTITSIGIKRAVAMCLSEAVRVDEIPEDENITEETKDDMEDVEEIVGPPEQSG